MNYLAIRTDKEEAEIIYRNEESVISTHRWLAHRELTTTLLSHIMDAISGPVEAIVVYQGPGSFTGLRIGFATANAYAYAKDLPLYACNNNNWEKLALDTPFGLYNFGDSKPFIVPEYGALPHITVQKK